MVNRHSINYCVDDVLELWNMEIAKVAINGFNEIDEDKQKKIHIH